MNICPYCKSQFEINPFGSGGKNRIYCYKCLPEGLNRPDRNRIKSLLDYSLMALDKIERGCDICGYNKNAAALEWHHPNQDKENNPGDLLRSGKIKEYKIEIAKCILVCANCHREIHNLPSDKEQISVELKHSLGDILLKYPNAISNNEIYIQLINQVIDYYQKVKSVKQTAYYFHCDKSTVSRLLKNKQVI